MKQEMSPLVEPESVIPCANPPKGSFLPPCDSSLIPKFVQIQFSNRDITLSNSLIASVSTPTTPQTFLVVYCRTITNP